MTPHRPAGRKAQILETLADMLSQPDCGRVTTAALAARLDVSEAALYRHFNSKTAIFEALIELAGTQIMQDLAHINATEPDARRQLLKHMQALLLFARRHPGLAKVLTGHALVTEDLGLQRQANAVIHAIEALLAQTARNAGQPSPWRRPPETVAGTLIHWIMGCWQQIHGGEPPPAQSCEDELAFLEV